MTYTLIPSIYLMDVASNGASSIRDTQPNLLAYLKVYLNGGTNPGGYAYKGFFPEMNALLIGGDWSVVWGPCVYCVKNATTVTNAMYVSYSPSQHIYMVGIAATNPISFFDWIVEDGDVDPYMAAAWPPTLPFTPVRHSNIIPVTTPAISAATAVGISNLLTQAEMVDSVHGDLRTFLNSKANANDTLIFGGHSLAGALSPTMALYLHPNPASSGWKQVLVLSTAGATPGNLGFANAFARAFPQKADAASGLLWNTDYANSHDVVPHAWDKLEKVVHRKDAAGNYPSIWGVLQGGGFKTIGGFVSLAALGARILAGGYYTAITRQWVTPNWGYWNWPANNGYPPVWTGLPTYTDTSPMTTIAELGHMIEATHVDQYYNFFKVMPASKMQHPAALDAGTSALA